MPSSNANQASLNDENASARIGLDRFEQLFKIEIGQAPCDQVVNFNNKGIYLNNDGNVGVGTKNTFNYKLAVNGNLVCKTDFWLTNTGVSWPDYVFQKGYKLTSIESLKNFIEKNKKLPDVPSAKEIETKGYSLKAMDRNLLQKVEEMSLYIIDLQNQINELKKQNRK